jgi:hypothetical protein
MSINVETRLIASAGVNSEAIDSGRATQGTFSIPAAITGTSIQCQFSNNGTNWTNVGTAISIAANGTYPLPDDMFKAAFGRLVSNASEATARTITFGLRR